MSGVVIPGQLEINVEQHGGPNAFPFSFMAQRPGEIRFTAIGGISTRLMVAAMLATEDTADGWELRALERADSLILTDAESGTLFKERHA